LHLRTLGIRRVLASAALGVSTAGGVVGLAASPASAATGPATIHATTAPAVAATSAGASAGNLKIVLPTTGTGGTLHLKTKPATGTVDWKAASGTKSTGTLAIGAFGTTTLVLTVTKASGATDDITLTGISYTTSGAHGTVTVTPTLSGYAFAPTSVVNAKAPAAVPGTQTLTATSAPFVTKGGNGETAGSWTLRIAGTKGQGWTKTATVTVKVASPIGVNCLATSYVLFSGTPGVAVASATGVSGTPAISAALANTGATCTVANHNELVLTFTNSGAFTGATGSVTIAVTGVKYDVGSKDANGGVVVSATGLGAAAVTTSNASNATIATYHVTANTPPVSVAPGANDAPVSPVDVVEQTPGVLTSGAYVCTRLTPTTNAFTTASKPTVRVTGGNGTVTPTVLFENSTGAKATTATTAEFAVYKVTGTSTTASTYSLSGLGVTAASTPGATVKAVVSETATTDCTASPAALGTATAYTIGAGAPTRIYGATLDATAAKELESVFPATGTPTSCPGGAGTTRPVILATDTNYPDALSSQYLAGSLDTGTLLTPVKALSSVTRTALRVEGVTHVYIVGGPFVVSTTVVNELKGMSAYRCGGRSVTSTAGTIKVTRIYGQTEYDTAKAIATRVPAAAVGSVSFPGAYAGTNTTGGNGKFNDTAGKASTAPSTLSTMKTAILATGQGFADAMSASTPAYRTGFPVLLTTPSALSSQASAAIQTLGITQVIVMGGELAVSTAVVSSLEALGVSVLRVAGVDYTDTAVQLADFLFTQGTGLHWTAPPKGNVTVARGDFYSDGLAGAVVNGNTTSPNVGQPLLLVLNPTTVGKYLPAFLTEAGKTGIDKRATAKISNLTILGGPLAVSTSAVTAMEHDLGH
jgi:putative cell wall-binding protein